MPSTEACSAGSRPQGQSTVCVCGGAWPADALADATQGSKRGLQSHLRETTVPVTPASSAWGLGCAGQRCRACLQDGPGKRLGWGGRLELLVPGTRSVDGRGGTCPQRCVSDSDPVGGSRLRAGGP